MSAAPESASFLVPLAALRPSTTASQAERRLRFDKASLAELAASIKTVGLLQRIIVRPLPNAPRRANGEGLFEIVAGERRVLAAGAAGLEEIAVEVRELNDQQVIEIQLVENLQRQGLHELAEAEGYETLQRKHGYSIDDLVAKVGKSRAYIYARLKLTALCSPARKAFHQQQISASIALLIARIRIESLQIKALEDLLEPPEELSTREAGELIHRRYMLSLADAPFPTGDAQLLPGVPMCGQCPKNTNAQPELFGDVKRGKGGAGTCTDPVCFGMKRDAAALIEIEKARAAGHGVIDGKKAQAIARYGTHALTNGFVKMDERCWDDPKQRTYAQVLGKEFKPQLLVVPQQELKKGAAQPAVIEVASREAINAALQERGVRKAASSSGSYTQSASQKKAKVERRFHEALYAQLRPRLPAKLGREEIEAIAYAFYVGSDHEVRKRMLALWGWESAEDGKKNWNDPNAPVRAHLHGCSESHLALFLQDCLYLADLQVSTFSDAKPDLTLAAAKRAKLDVAAIRRTLEAPGKAAAAKKAAKPRAKK